MIKPEMIKPEAIRTGATKPGAIKAEAVKASCDSTTWIYVDGKCLAGKWRKPKMVRAATDRPAIAAISIGRAAPAVSAPAPAAASPSKSAQAVPADAAASAAAEASPRPVAAASKKPQRTARNHNRRREPTGNDGSYWSSWREVRVDDGWGGRGYAGDRARGGYGREGSYRSFW